MTSSAVECFMTAFAAGLAFALVYEVLRIIRIMLPYRWVTFLCDIAFFVLAAGFVVRLSVHLGNYVRRGVVFGFGAGVFAYITTIGRLMSLLENAAAASVKRALSFIFGGIFHIFAKCFGFIAQMLSAVFGTFHKFSVNYVKKSAKHLKKRRTMVYNNKELKSDSRGSEAGNVIYARVKRGIPP